MYTKDEHRLICHLDSKEGGSSHWRRCFCRADFGRISSSVHRVLGCTLGHRNLIIPELLPQYLDYKKVANFLLGNVCSCHLSCPLSITSI